MKRILIGILMFLLYLALVIVGAFALHFEGTRLVLFCLILGLLGALATVFVLWYLHEMSGGSAQMGGVDTPDAINLNTLLGDADARIRRAGRGKSHRALEERVAAAAAAPVSPVFYGGFAAQGDLVTLEYRRKGDQRSRTDCLFPLGLSTIEQDHPGHPEERSAADDRPLVGLPRRLRGPASFAQPPEVLFQFQ
jgi:hypothetical protein